MADFAFVKVLFEEIAKTEFIKSSEEASEDILEVHKMISIFQDLAHCFLDKIKEIDQKELDQIKVKVKIEDFHKVEPSRVTQLKTEKFDEDYLDSFPDKEIKEEFDIDGPSKPLENLNDDSFKVKEMENQFEINAIPSRLKSSLFLKNEKRCVDSRRREAPKPVIHTVFPCDFCERKFLSEKSLKKHFVTLHQKIYS